MRTAFKPDQVRHSGSLGSETPGEPSGVRALWRDMRAVVRIRTLRSLMIGTAILSGATAGLAFWAPAFYERHSSRGIAVLERVIEESRAAGALVLLDVKRGDIGSTSQAYADAYLDPASPLAADAVTASPFLGFGSLTPMLDTARKHGAGVFVLALTSIGAIQRRRSRSKT